MCYQHLASTEPVAQKQHQCQICLEPIQIGEKHIKDVGIFEGDFQSVRLHSKCNDLAGEFLKFYGEGLTYQFEDDYLYLQYFLASQSTIL